MIFFNKKFGNIIFFIYICQKLKNKHIYEQI